VKLPGHRPGLPGNVISFYIVPLDPAYKAGPAGHFPVKRYSLRKEIFFVNLSAMVDRPVLVSYIFSRKPR